MQLFYLIEITIFSDHVSYIEQISVVFFFFDHDV
jgi:hypothetical protein